MLTYAAHLRQRVRGIALVERLISPLPREHKRPTPLPPRLRFFFYLEILANLSLELQRMLTDADVCAADVC